MQKTILLFFLLLISPIVCSQDFNYFFKTISNDSVNLFSFASLPIEDGYFVVGPYTTNTQSGIYLQKLDEDGNSDWAIKLDEQSVDNPPSMNTGSLLIPFGDNFLLAYNKRTENNSTDIGMIQFDSEGEILWQTKYGDERKQNPHILLGTKDGGFIVGGYESYVSGITPFQYWTMYVVKADSLGNQQWEQRYTLDEGNSSLTVDIIETLDGGYLLGGYGHLEEDFAGAYQQEAYVVKIDSLGSAEWERNYGTLEWDDSGVNVYQYPDSTYLLYGSEGARESMFNYLMFRHIDQEGNTLEENTYEEWYTTGTWRLFPLEDGGFLGFANHRLKKNAPVRPRMMRFTPYCRDTLWTKVIDYLPEEENLGIRDVDQTNDGGFIITGFRSSPFPQFGWVLKVDSLGNGCLEFGCDSSTITHIEEIPQSEQKRFSLYPNPTNDYFTIDLNGIDADEDTRLDILNMSGQVLSSAKIDHLEVISTSDLESGIYFIRLHINGKLIESDKLVIIR